MLEMSETDQVHLRAVMLFMLEMSAIIIIFHKNNNTVYTLSDIKGVKDTLDTVASLSFKCTRSIFDIFDML